MMKFKIPKSKPCLAVVGLGRSGTSLVEYLQNNHIPFVVWDDYADKKMDGNTSWAQHWVSPEQMPWQDIGALILSPGIPHQHPYSHPAAIVAKRHDCPIWCDVECFLQLHQQHICVGVTGTNGKSTTTQLLGHIMDHAGKHVLWGGNLGTPVFTLESAAHDHPPVDHFVLELSSYQLERIETAALDVAIVLNISPDHLDRHGGWDGYVAAKHHIFDLLKPGGYGLLGIDQPNFLSLTRRNNSEFSRIFSQIFGMSVQHDLEDGAVYQDGYFWWKRNGKTLRKILYPTNQPYLQGMHNTENALAAFATCVLLGVDDDVILEGFHTFVGLPHRMEPVGECGHIRFINDSKATNVESTLKALASYSRVIWIGGGRPKGDDYQLILRFKSRIAHAFLIGEAADLIAHALGQDIEHTFSGHLDQALDQAFEMGLRMSEPVVILLSPACASFDQFRDFEDRGNQFRQLVDNKIQTYIKKPFTPKFEQPKP